MKRNLLSVLAVSLCAVGSVAFAAQGPQLVPDYNRDGKIDEVDYGRLAKGEAFTVWLNDDDDAAGTNEGANAGDQNIDLHDVPGGEDNDKDCEDDKVNGRCDLLDFFPVLVDVTGVPEWKNYTWTLSSKSVNAVFTGLRTDTAGDFHTKDVKGLGGETPLYEAAVTKLADEDAEFPDGFLEEGKGVILIEGAALAEGGLTLRGEKDGDPVEVTLDLRVKNVESLYGWMNLRPKENSVVRLNSSPSPDSRHFILVHGYNTNHDEARGNAAEFYKKLWQSGSDALFTAVEWKGDQSQIDLSDIGITVTPNYFVNVENAFAAARPFAEACKQLKGEKILVGHSLGNMLISSAIKDYGLDYTKFVMLNAAVAREAYDAGAYDEDMVDEDWLGDKAKVQDEGEGEGGNSLTNHLDRAARWYRNFADRKYDPYEYRRKLNWRGRFANLPRTVNYYSPTDNVLLNPDPHDPDPDKYKKGEVFLEYQKRLVGTANQKTGFGFWSFSEKMKGTWVVDAINEVLTNLVGFAETDAMKCEGGWGENDEYVDGIPFSPTNTHFTPFLDERMKTIGMLDILPAETERLRAQHLADAIPAESFAAGANKVATLENVNMEGFIGENEDWPVYEGGRGETQTNQWKHSTFREVAFYHTSKLYASIAAVGKPRVIIDTDLGSSMDDLFTIDFAARMRKAGKLDLMAVMMNRPDQSDPEGKGEFLTFADRYLASLGLGDLPIGKAEALAPDLLPQRVFNPYWTLIYSNNVTGVGQLLPTNRTPEQIASLTNAVSLYRKLLDNAPDKSVVVCSAGFLTNLKTLMDSEAHYKGDDIGSTGMELIAAKVKELRIMAGCFDPSTAPEGKDGAEYNAAGDPVATKKVFEEWPTPIIMSSWEVGLKLEYKPEDVLADFPAGTFDPVIRAAYTYWHDPAHGVMNRLWDPMTVLPLTEGDQLVPLSEMGGISVDDNGVTTFTPDPSSNRCYQVASNMNATAVMNRLRAIYRTGNPSLPDAVRCIKDAGVDYNGHDLTFKVPKFTLGAYGSNDVHMAFTIGDKSYEPDEVTYDPVLEVFSVHFTVPAADATAGNVYDGVLTITLDNEKLGPNVVKTVPTQLVQGRQEQAGSETSWFNETDLEIPTNYVPATAMSERCLATVEATVLFTGKTFVVEYQTATNAVQGAVRIVGDGADGYKFQYYACVGKTNEESYVRGWWDFNVGGEDVSEIKPTLDKEYTIRAEAYYFEDARGEGNTLVISVEEVGSNRGMVKQFIGNLVNAEGGQGGSTRLNSVGLAGEGSVSSLVGNYCTTCVNTNLARVGETECATVAEAVAAADGQPIRLLHAANWKPTAADLGKPVKFLNKSLLVLDDSELPFGMRLVWSDADGNDGTLTLTRLYGDLEHIAPYLHEIWYDDYEDSDLTGDDAPFGDLQSLGMGGCSSVRVGNFHGRNLDIAVSDLASIVVHMAATSNRFASVGTTQWFGVSETALSTNGVSAHRFDVLPNWMLDGINEKGVAINVNIIPMDVPQDGEDPDSDERPALHARKVVRYVLDHAASATDAVEQLKGFRIFGNIGAVENNIHWMISDAVETFVVEVIQGEVVAREHPIMTNFNLNWDNGNQRAITDPENWGPERYFWAAAHSNDTDTIFQTYTLHAEGIERYIQLRDSGAGYRERGKTLEGMVDLMRETQYSKIAYLPLAETYLSDLLDMQEVKNAGFKSLEDIYAASNAVKLAVMWEELRPKMTNVYENLAKYRNPETIVPYSITTHNVTFDLKRKMFRIVVQEEYDEPFNFWLVESAKVTLPACVQGFTYVVSNLTAGAEAEITPTETTAGGATYELPIGAKVAIYCVPADGYVVSGTNPYVIDEVTAETTLEDVTLPTAVEPPEPSDALGKVTYPKADKNTGYLKAKSTATWKAKADLGCVFTGWEPLDGAKVPATYGLLSANELKNPSLKLKIAADEDKILTNFVSATWAWIDEDPIGAVELTPSNLVVESKSYVTATVSGLPSGLKFNKKTLAITGAPKKAGTKSVKVTVKNASGYTWKGTFEMTVSADLVAMVTKSPDEETEVTRTGEPVVLRGDALLGKVTGSKVYVAGKKASLKATPAKNCVFLGWYEDAAFANAATNLPKGYRTASQSVVVPPEGLNLYARYAELQAWTMGTFDGVITSEGPYGKVTFTVSNKGKVSGKLYMNGKTYTFAAKEIDDCLEEEGVPTFVVKPLVKKAPFETLTIRITEGEAIGLGSAVVGEFEGADGRTCAATAVQNGWKVKDKALNLPAFGKNVTASVNTHEDPSYLDFKFGANGAVTVKGRLEAGKVSTKSQVLPVRWESAARRVLKSEVCVYLPKKNEDGTDLCLVYEFFLTVGDDGKFGTAELEN